MTSISDGGTNATVTNDLDSASNDVGTNVALNCAVDMSANVTANKRQDWKSAGIIVVACAALLPVILGVFWLRGNLRYLHKESSAAETAMAIFKKYQPESLDNVTYQVANVQKGFPGAVVELRVWRGETNIATINVKGFLGFGWQEEYYERLGPE